MRPAAFHSAAIRNIYNNFVACLYPDVNTLTEEYRMWSHASGPFYKSPDEARFVNRLRDMLGGTGITFGQWVGTTPDNEADVAVERFLGSSRQAYLEERKKRRVEAAREDRAVRPLAPREECCSEEDIRSRQPRILLTNYRQLEVLTSTSYTRNG